MSNFSFAIISDIHVYTSTGSSPGAGIPSNFSKVIAQLASLTPHLWWSAAMPPAAIPTMARAAAKSMAGGAAFAKHQAADGIRHPSAAGSPGTTTTTPRRSATATRRRGPAERRRQQPVCFVGQTTALLFAASRRAAPLSLLYVIDQISAERDRCSSAPTPSRPCRCAAALHRPRSACVDDGSRPSESYRDELWQAVRLAWLLGVFAGHEHLVWEQELSFPEGNLHHIHVGTASGTCNFPLSRSTLRKTLLGQSRHPALFGSALCARSGNPAASRQNQRLRRTSERRHVFGYAPSAARR